MREGHGDVWACELCAALTPGGVTPWCLSAQPPGAPDGWETWQVCAACARASAAGARSAPLLVAMHLTAYGQDAEASIRQMCSGHVPVVGQRYVWLCTGVSTTDGRMQADFQLTPVEDGPQE